MKTLETLERIKSDITFFGAIFYRPANTICLSPNPQFKELFAQEVLSLKNDGFINLWVHGDKARMVLNTLELTRIRYLSNKRKRLRELVDQRLNLEKKIAQSRADVLIC